MKNEINMKKSMQEYQRITPEEVFRDSSPQRRLLPSMIAQICTILYFLCSISSIAGYLYYVKHYNNNVMTLLPGSGIWIAAVVVILLLITICSAILCAMNFGPPDRNHRYVLHL